MWSEPYSSHHDWREASTARELVEVARAGRAVNDAVIGSIDRQRPHLAIGIVLQHPFPRHGDAETVGDDVDAPGASEIENCLPNSRRIGTAAAVVCETPERWVLSCARSH